MKHLIHVNGDNYERKLRACSQWQITHSTNLLNTSKNRKVVVIEPWPSPFPFPAWCNRNCTSTGSQENGAVVPQMPVLSCDLFLRTRPLSTHRTAILTRTSPFQPAEWKLWLRAFQQDCDLIFFSPRLVPEEGRQELEFITHAQLHSQSRELPAGETAAVPVPRLRAVMQTLCRQQRGYGKGERSPLLRDWLFGADCEEGHA